MASIDATSVADCLRNPRIVVNERSLGKEYAFRRHDH
jgi:hypothetical protein